MPKMTLSETKALRLFQERGFKNIVFRSNKTPDFLADSERFEVKRAVGGKVMFYPSQVSAMQPADKVLVFVDSEEDLTVEATWQDVTSRGYIGDFKLYICADYRLIRVSLNTRNALELLKIAWKERSVDSVVEKLIAERRVEMVRALGIQIPESTKERQQGE